MTIRAYHVTETKLVRRIRALGLRLMQSSNWINGNGERLGGGCIFAFEELPDALRWAAKMDWEMYRETGSRRISILTLETEESIWDTDYADPLSQCGSAGRWIKTFQPIPAKNIIESRFFTQTDARMLVTELQAKCGGGR